MWTLGNSLPSSDSSWQSGIWKRISASPAKEFNVFFCKFFRIFFKTISQQNLCMRIQRFSILMIFFSETYPENVQNNFMKNPANCVREFNAFSFWVYFLEIFFQNISWTISQQIWLLCKIIQRFSTLMIFSGKYIPSIQQSKNQELLRIVVETFCSSALW